MPHPHNFGYLEKKVSAEFTRLLHSQIEFFMIFFKFDNGF